MLFDTFRQTGQAYDSDRSGKTRDAGDRVGKFDRVPFAFRHHDRGYRELALGNDVERRQSVADGSEITADDKQQWDIQRRHPVEHRALAVEGDHDAANTFNEKRSGRGIDRSAAEFDQLVEVDTAAFARGSNIRRQRRAKTPRRDPIHLFGSYRSSERTQQDSRIAGIGHRSIIAAHDRLERVDWLVGLAQIADERGSHEGLADVGAGRGDEVGSHSYANSFSRTISASRAISSSGCCAVNVRRRRAVPAGTVGGRIATTRKPSRSNACEADSAASSSPMTIGTIGLCASGSPARRVNAFAFATGRAA